MPQPHPGLWERRQLPRMSPEPASLSLWTGRRAGAVGPGHGPSLTSDGWQETVETLPYGVHPGGIPRVRSVCLLAAPSCPCLRPLLRATQLPEPDILAVPPHGQLSTCEHDYVHVRARVCVCTLNVCGVWCVHMCECCVYIKCVGGVHVCACVYWCV